MIISLISSIGLILHYDAHCDYEVMRLDQLDLENERLSIIESFTATSSNTLTNCSFTN